jgi:hypothetical protein
MSSEAKIRDVNTTLENTQITGDSDMIVKILY